MNPLICLFVLSFVSHVIPTLNDTFCRFVNAAWHNSSSILYAKKSKISISPLVLSE